MNQLVPYYALMALTGALGIGKGVLLVKMLDVEGFGAYGLMVVLGLAFQFVIGLGVVEGLGVVLPGHFASKRQNAIGESVLAAARMIVVRAAVVALSSVAFFAAIGHLPLALAALLGLSTALTTIPMVLARSEGNLKGFGLRMFLKGLATLALAAAGARLAGAPGAVIGEFLGAMAALIASWGWGQRTGVLAWRDTPSRERELRAEGWPLLMQGANFVAQQNIERWAVVATLGLGGVGKYGFAQLFMTAANLVHATFFQQAGSRVLRHMAAGESSRDAIRHLLRFGAAIGGATLLVLAVLAYKANDLLHAFLPAFGDFAWGLLWLGAAALAQLLHYFDWVLVGRADQHVIGRIAWLSTILSIVLCTVGFVFHLSLEYFLFFYFLGRLFVLTTTFGAAWMGSSKASSR